MWNICGYYQKTPQSGGHIVCALSPDLFWVAEKWQGRKYISMRSKQSVPTKCDQNTSTRIAQNVPAKCGQNTPSTGDWVRRQIVLRALWRGSVRVAQGTLIALHIQSAGFFLFFAVSRETLGILCDTRRCVAEKIVFCRPKGFFTQSVRKNCLRKAFA